MIHNSEVSTNFTDVAGRPYKMSYADGAFSRSYYNARGQLEKQTDPDNVTTLFQYNGRGEQEYQAIDMNGNGTIDLGGLDRVSRTVTLATNLGVDLIQTRTWVWMGDNSPSETLVNDSRAATDGLRQWTLRFGISNWTHTSVKFW